jgi:transcription elongation factor Elf1
MSDNRGFFKKLWDGITKATCPKCDKSGGQETSRTQVDVSDKMETVTQEEKHYDAKGEYTGSTRRPVQVMKRTVVYDQHYRCDYCNHSWRERKSETKQL